MADSWDHGVQTSHSGGHPRADRAALQRDAVAVFDRLKSVRSQLSLLALEESALEIELQRLQGSLATHDTVANGSEFGDLRALAHAMALSFGYARPHDFQLDAAASVCTGVSTFLIWPAGGGKGLTTQLVAALSPGKVVVCCVPIMALAHELCGNTNVAFGGDVTLADGTTRPISLVLGGCLADDFHERVGDPPKDFAERRAATLHGAADDELCSVER